MEKSSATGHGKILALLTCTMKKGHNISVMYNSIYILEVHDHISAVMRGHSVVSTFLFTQIHS